MPGIQAKAILFDFDGVIADSEGLHFNALQKTCRPHGHEFSRTDYDRELLGFDDRDAFRHLWQKKKMNLSEVELKKLILTKNKTFHGLIATGVPIFPGVTDLIQDLKNKNVPVGIVSGALEDEIIACLTHAKLKDFFEFIVAAGHVHQSKPDPECYETGFAKMKHIVPTLTKNNCWVIEDSPAGIQSARSAGLPVIGITHSFTGDKLSEALHVVARFAEIEVVD